MLIVPSFQTLGGLKISFMYNNNHFNGTHGGKPYSAQEFVKIKSWQLLVSSICLRNQY